MALLSLAQVRQSFWDLCDQQVAFTDATQTQLDAATFRINQASERIINSGKWKYTIRRITIPIFGDYITLPRELGTVLGITLITDSGCCCVSTIYTKFHQIAHSCFCGGRVSISISETAQTFLVPTGNFTFRVVSTDNTGTITFYGGYDEDGNQFFGGETLTLTGGTVNGTRTYSSMPETGGIQKTTTTAPVFLYSVDSDGEETLIAVYAPYETIPSYKKYKIPNCNSQFTSALVLGKLAYVPATEDYDIVIPSNWGALKMALKALQNEDTLEDQLADANWERCYNILDKEVQETDADSEFSLFRVSQGTGCEGVLPLM